MNCLTYMSAYRAAIFRRTSQFIAKASLHRCYNPSWNKCYGCGGVKTIDLEFLQTRFRAQCYSSQRTAGGKKSRSRKSDVKPVMDQEKDAFFVVRKGDIVGVYKNLSDCQAQVGTSICDPPVSVYKGYSLPKNTEEHLVSRGLKDPLYTIKASDLTEDLFGSLTPCPLPVPSSSDLQTSSKDASKKRSQDVLASETSCSCIIEFDGASKGNPGQAGAGVVLRACDGSVICRLREGVGKATCNAAEYRAIILGLRYALNKGYTSVQVQGDSKLVCMQIEGSWKVRNENLSNLCKEAKQLKNKFLSFQITHVLRELNSEADAQANLAITLADGQVEEV